MIPEFYMNMLKEQYISLKKEYESREITKGRSNQ